MSRALKEPGPIAQAVRPCQQCRKPEMLCPTKLLTCSACRGAQYCSRECQRAHWPIHKVLCKISTNTDAILRSKSKEEKGGDGRDWGIVDKHMRTFLKIHTVALGAAYPQALNLRAQPSNIDTFIFMVELSPTFTNKPLPFADSAKLFTLVSASLMTIDEVTDFMNPDAASIVRQQAEAYKVRSDAIKAEGGVGVGTMMTRCGPIIHAHQFIIRAGDLKMIPVQKDWQRSLANAMENGLRF